MSAATTSVDIATAAGVDATLEEGRSTLVLRAGGTRVAPEGTQVRNPLQDLVPATLVTSIVTETGVLHAPYGPALLAAAATASARRATTPGFAALLARREAAVAGDADADVAQPAPDRAPVDVATLRNPPRDAGA